MDMCISSREGQEVALTHGFLWDAAKLFDGSIDVFLGSGHRDDVRVVGWLRNLDTRARPALQLPQPVAALPHNGLVILPGDINVTLQKTTQTFYKNKPQTIQC